MGIAVDNKLARDISALVVDDQVGIRKIVKVVLQSMGIVTVYEASDGSEAWAVLELVNKHIRTKKLTKIQVSQQLHKHIDFIICDWRMPGMSGIEFLEALRKDEKLKSLPVLMLTAESSREQVARAVELGISDYIVKPFTAGVLESKIRAALKLGKMV